MEDDAGCDEHGEVVNFAFQRGQLARRWLLLGIG